MILLVACPQARCLRQAMSDHWQMPDEEQWSYTGKRLSVTASGQVFKGAAELDPSTLWRTWHVHNSITHNTGHILVTTSVGFLLSYRDSLEASALAPPCDGKGKQEVQSDERPAVRNPRAEKFCHSAGCSRWTDEPRLTSTVHSWSRQVKLERVLLAETAMERSYLRHGSSSTSAVVHLRQKLLVASKDYAGQIIGGSHR